jgi:MoxR-like ATPase
MVEIKEYFHDLEEMVRVIGKKYFVDPLEERVGGREVKYWNVLMGVFTYIGRKNALLIGNPGTGKTTFASVISSAISGLPFDLFDNLKIVGHPEQTKDTMLARVDLGRLAEEGVVWQPVVYLPSIIIDEINRLPPGKQSILLEFVRTGTVEHLGKYFSRDKPAFFATQNFDGPGTYPLPSPQLDRFDISLEFQPGPAYIQDLILQANSRINKELKDPAVTKEIVSYLLSKDRSIEEKLEYLNKKSRELRKKRTNLPSIEPLDEYMLDYVYNLEYTPDAITFLHCIWEEINTTKLYGTNRRSDPRDYSEHNKVFASSKVNEGISPRFWSSAKYYAGALALYLGDKEVDFEHVWAIAPYVLSHRLEFTDDYRATYAQQKRLRGEREEMDLTRRLLEEIKQNYDNVSYDIKLLDAFLSGNLESRRLGEVEKVLKGPEPDHPLFKVYYNEAKKRFFHNPR